VGGGCWQEMGAGDASPCCCYCYQDILYSDESGGGKVEGDNDLYLDDS